MYKGKSKPWARGPEDWRDGTSEVVEDMDEEVTVEAVPVGGPGFGE